MNATKGTLKFRRRNGCKKAHTGTKIFGGSPARERWNRRHGLNLLQRHILWSVFTTCLVAVGVFAAILMLGNALKDLLGFVLAGQIAPEMFLLLIGLLIPFVASFAMPMGMLTGVLLVLGRMSAQQEITAMRAAGLGLLYVARPVLLLGALGAVLALAVNFEYMPRARTAYKTLLSETVQKNPLSFIVPKTFIREFPRVVLFVEEKVDNELRDVWFWRLDAQDRVREFGRAKSGEAFFDQETSTLNVTLREVSAEARDDRDPENYNRLLGTSTIGEVPLTFKVDDIFSRRGIRQKHSQMTLAQLVEARDQLDPVTQEKERMKISMAIGEKGATALAVLAFAVLAVPLGIRVSRKETSANLGIALALVMAYYFAGVVIGWLEQYPELRPDLLVWAPAVGFLLFGMWLFRRVGRA